MKAQINEISDFLLILKDAVENNDDAYYLLNFIEIIYDKTNELTELTDNYY